MLRRAKIRSTAASSRSFLLLSFILVGMPSDFLQQVFTLFSQRRKAGTGIKSVTDRERSVTLKGDMPVRIVVGDRTRGPNRAFPSTEGGAVPNPARIWAVLVLAALLVPGCATRTH